MSKLIIKVLRASYFQQFPFMLCIFLLLVVFVRTCLKEITSRMCVLLMCLYIFTRKKNRTYIVSFHKSSDDVYLVQSKLSTWTESSSQPSCCDQIQAGTAQLHYWMRDGWLSGHHVAVTGTWYLLEQSIL